MAILPRLMICLLSLVLGITVYAKKHSEASARVLFFMMICFACGSNLAIPQGTLSPSASILSSIVLFCLPLLLHFVVIFPEKKAAVSRHPSLLALLYVPAMALWLAQVFVIFRNSRGGLGWPAVFLHQPLFIVTASIVAVYIACTLVVLVHSLLSTHIPESKKQIQCLLYGMAVAALLTLPGFKTLSQDFQSYLTGGSPLPYSFLLAEIVWLLALVVSIFKYRLMEIDIVINRSLIYFVMSTLVVLIYLFLFGMVSRISKIITNENTTATYVIPAIIAAFTFRPVYARIELWVDRFFYKENYSLTQAMERLTNVLITVRDPHQIFQKVFQTIENCVHIQKGMLWLKDDDTRDFKQACMKPDIDSQKPLSIADTHPLMGYFKESSIGLTKYQVRTQPQFNDGRGKILELYQMTDSEIFLPLIFNGSLFGIMGFSKKRSNDIYSAREVRILSGMARQTAMAMENAQAYNRIEKLNDEMSEKVRQIGQQKEEILSLQKRLLNENRYLKEEIRQNFNFDEIIGESASMKEVLQMIKKVAPTFSTVLIRGESGTGKELVARAIHLNSSRSENPFIRINCSAIPTNLLESELFGHEKGAFTGAATLKPGKFELAEGGSIFLDEIAELETSLQVKLLRVLQEREFERVGGTKTFKADVRIIAATNRNIEKAISTNEFREDLFYRLNVISITIPPLRARMEDVRELTIHFLNKFSKQTGKPILNIGSEAMDLLKSYAYPGNVRELANIIERAVVLSDGETLEQSDLPPNLTQNISQRSEHADHSDFSIPFGEPLFQVVEAVEKKYIKEAIEKSKGNKSEAARILGLKRSTLIGKIEKYDIL